MLFQTKDAKSSKNRYNIVKGTLLTIIIIIATKNFNISISTLSGIKIGMLLTSRTLCSEHRRVRCGLVN